MSGSSQPAPNRWSSDTADDRAAIATIVALVGKGMTVREIRAAFPELTSDMIRDALLQAAEIINDEDASLQSTDPVGEIIAAAQQSSGLSEVEAMELAVAETRAYRQAKAARGNK